LQNIVLLIGLFCQRDLYSYSLSFVFTLSFSLTPIRSHRSLYLQVCTYALPSIRLGERGSAKTKPGARKQQHERCTNTQPTLLFFLFFHRYADRYTHTLSGNELGEGKFKMIGLFCKRALYNRLYSAKETYTLYQVLSLTLYQVLSWETAPPPLSYRQPPSLPT